MIEILLEFLNTLKKDNERMAMDLQTGLTRVVFELKTLGTLQSRIFSYADIGIIWDYRWVLRNQ